ncbi:PREDICTED: myosin light chain kinase 3 isoform X3 [Gekko japonicus]|uniref:Myosin light chain kinase 3 isoform X3 n=1 Tax=Gekko japonicus TaxID=146911 RepID=A0ABM1JTX5_GEKJA|nr:PREDICTED: myosin light chain kinase 3 isoform X3 [Gekko japonicus]
MGTLYQGSSTLHRSLRLSMGGSCVSDYVKKFATKDKSEEKASKGKHVPIKKGIQAEGKNSLEGSKKEKKLDEPDGVCEKVNSSGTNLSKADSGPCGKERMAQTETSDALGCQQQKDVGISALVQNDALCCIAGSNPPGLENTDKAPGLEEPPTKTVDPKPKESEKAASRLISPTREAVPSTSGSEVIQTRLSIDVQMSDAQEKPLKSQEGNVGGGPAGKGARVPIPQPPSPAGEGAKCCPDSSKDDSPPPPAPFEHRIVSVKQTEVSAGYLICHHEVLGGGRFGEVRKCTEKSTGLCLAAKIIKVKVAKEREEVKNEINIMNQLNHVNLIQLYDAFECKNNLTLIMEYVDGGELFDRITDENYHLTELDAILFTKQICEGIYYLHQQYILHLDLKPENILCVNRTGNQIKIIDFGLARRYKPREKLKVNFGTPEFLAPEVVNYDFVSFPTDMWSVGVIAYMLLSGLSPFLGETDAETMNYIVNCSWDFDAEAFEQVSEEAKDFVSRLLVKEKSGRISAANCLKHEWLADLSGKAQKSRVRLKSQLLLQSYMTHKKWKKHFYVVAAANRLRRFPSQSDNPA